MPETYLAGSILVTLFCFLPTGIAAIIFASQVSEKWKAGDVVGAAESSRKARLWVIVSVVAGCIAWVLLFIIGMAADPNTTSMPAP
ncbi:CD225/dispanin family protein [Streptomyces virginiae]|uniref:CD225/dispanin family protein n=1 Tax=Streptomyces virginiae TaxID=1961 RepID=UPI0036AE2120